VRWNRPGLFHRFFAADVLKQTAFLQRWVAFRTGKESAFSKHVLFFKTRFVISRFRNHTTGQFTREQKGCGGA